MESRSHDFDAKPRLFFIVSYVCQQLAFWIRFKVFALNIQYFEMHSFNFMQKYFEKWLQSGFFNVHSDRTDIICGMLFIEFHRQ